MGTSCLGGVCIPPTLLMVTGGPNGLVLGSYQAGAGWTLATPPDSPNTIPSVTVDGVGNGIGLYTSAGSNELSYAEWTGGLWAMGGAILLPDNVTIGDTMGQSFLDGTGSSTTYAVYQDIHYDFWSLTFASGTWTSPIAVGLVPGQNYGPVPPTIASLGADAVVGFTDGAGPDVNWVAAAELSGGAWGQQDDIVGAESYSITPEIIPLSAGPELLMVFNQNQSSQVSYVTRTAGIWSGSANITSALTNDRVALAPLPGGDAILAFRGTDHNLYWSEYSAGAWSAPAPLVTTGSTATDTSPAVTHGLGTDVAELAYVQGGVVYASSLVGTTWSAPANVGTSSAIGVALAAEP